MHRKNQDGQLRALGEHRLGELDAVGPGHGDIEQRDVRFTTAHRFERLRRRLRFAAHHQVRFLRNHGRETFAHDGVVIYQQHAFPNSAAFGGVGLFRFQRGGHVVGDLLAASGELGSLASGSACKLRYEIGAATDCM